MVVKLCAARLLLQLVVKDGHYSGGGCATAKDGKRTMGDAKVLIVDDHPIVRSGLVQFIRQQHGLAVCGEAGTAQEALQLARERRPDVIVLDISLGHANGLSVISDIRAEIGDIPVLVLSMHDEFLYAERALRAGAKGYIMKDASTETVVQGIRAVLKGEISLSPEMSRRLLNRLVHKDAPDPESTVAGLTDRELQVFEMVGNGRKSRQIAEDLHISVKTIEAHRANIKKKLNLSNHIELLQYATQWVIDPKD